MNLVKSRKNGLLVVKVSGERLDARVAERFKELVKEMFAKGEDKVLFDLTDVAFMDSSGLGALVFGLKRVGRGGTFALCGLNKPIVTLLSLTRLDTLFEIYDSEDEALEDLGG